MRGGVTGWGTDEKAVLETLRGKTPDQISELRGNYSEHYRRNLDGDLGKELSGSALERARSLMRSDQAGADAINLRDQISAGWRGDNKEILSTLERASPEQRADIAKAYQQRYGANNPVKDPVNALQRDLQGKLGTREYGQASALLDATRVDSASRAADAHASRAAGEKMQHALSGYFPDKPAVFDSLQQLSPSQRELVAKNPALMKQLSESLDKPEHDRAMALLRGDQAGATAAQIQTSLGGWLGADKSGLQGLLEGKSPEQLRGIQDAYKAQTGKSLDAELAQRMSGKDLEVTRGLLGTGTVPEAQRLDYAMSGAGTDEDAIKRTLAGKTPEQISQIRDDYQRRYGRPLDADLHGELGGRDEFQVDQLLKGKPGSPGDAVLRAEQARDFERGWSSGAFDAANRLFKGEADGARLDRDVAAARQAYGQAMNDGKLTDGERQDVMKKVGFAGEDQKAYQQVKDSGSDAAATTAVAGGTAAAVFFTGGAATPLAIAGYGALGAATRAGVKGALEGQALGGDGLMREGLLGGLEGATAVLPGGAGAGRAGLQTAEAVAAEQAARSGLSGILRDGLAGGAYSGAVSSAANRATQSETWRNGVLPGLADVTRDGVSGGAMGGATGTAVATATEGARRVL
ncbi:MAG TPA: annexin, partial [Myxococcaceae bacterium]|nr:annexin [Myxococcaceae bacterium]